MAEHCRGWWGCRSPRQQAWLRWGGPILAIALLVGIDWIRYRSQGVATPEVAQALFVRVGFTLGLSALVMVAAIRRWPVQMLGLFALLLGMAGMLIRVLGGWGSRPDEWERDLIQSLLDIGSLVLLVGLVLWSAGRVLRRTDGDASHSDQNTRDDWDGTERRGDSPGRRTSDYQP